MRQATETNSPKPTHQVLSSSESHFLGANYLPQVHMTSQRIKAVRPLAEIAYKFFTEGAAITEVKGLMGCNAGAIEELGEGIYQSMLTLTQPLQSGEEVEIDLFTRFGFTESSPPPPPQFRRRIIGEQAWRAFEVAVYFPSNNPPQKVTWAEWEGTGDSDAIVPDSGVPLKLEPMQACSGEYLLARWAQRAAQPGKVLGIHWTRHLL